MERDRLVRGVALALAIVAILACGRRGGAILFDAGGADSGPPVAACMPSAFESRAIEFCRAQSPPPPGAGQLGASCTMDSQCASGQCLMPFGSSHHYCTQPCPVGTECPIGYSCQDTGTSWGSVCYDSVCIYGGVDASDCVTNTMDEVERACASDCSARAGAWLDCLVAAGRICGNADADARCGIERGLLEDCCAGCSRTSW